LFPARARRTAWTSGLALVAALALSPFALAAPGQLDSAFDSDGRVTTDLGGSDDGIVAAAVQSDGKIVVVGISPGGFDDDAVLARYTSTGALDSTFDGDGICVVAGLDPRDVAIQPDGKIVVAGSADSADLDRDFAVARVDSSCTPDTSFGDNGLAGEDGTFNGNDEARGMALQADGKIVVAGWSDQESEGGDAVVARFTVDGDYDSSFLGDGRRILAMGAHSEAFAVAIQPNGKIVVAGQGGGGAGQFALARLLDSGSLDDSFGDDGHVRTDFGGSDSVLDVALQPDGKIVAAGVTSGDFAVARYKKGGGLDPTFSDNGRNRTDFHGGDDSAAGVVLQPNGRIVLAGEAAPAGPDEGPQFGLARYRSDGALDRTFSRNGKQQTRFGSNHEDFGTDVVLQGGRIVVVGRATPGLPHEFDFGLARYFGQNP
jgi:uncharacterized delta-60 repeat protein